MLDSWTYSNGFIFEKNYKSTIEYELQHVNKAENFQIKAFEACIRDKSSSSCNLVEKYSKEMEESSYIWKLVRENLYEDLVPLCSYGTTNLTLKHCEIVKRIENEQCFTFNETEFVHKLGTTQGINFLVNFDYPQTINELSNPVEVGKFSEAINCLFFLRLL